MKESSMTITSVTIKLLRRHITLHLMEILKGVKYDCDQCDNKTPCKSIITTHMKKIYEVIH